MPSAAWDVHAAVRDVLAPAEDLPFAQRAARSSRGAVPSAKRSAPSLTEIVSLDLVDSPFPERGVHSAKRSAPSLEEIVSSDLLDSSFPERSVPSAKRSVPSKTGTLHTQTADGVVAGETRYAALAKRSAETAARLLRRVSRHRAKGK